MNIHVKHVFISDLDPNSTLWWSEDKVDKINYNFRQFELGGAQGVQGYPGSNGEIGESGSQGFQGLEGYKGAQGFQGEEGIEPWKKVDYTYIDGVQSPEDRRYLMPKYNFGPALGDDVLRVVFSDVIVSWQDDGGDPNDPNSPGSGDGIINNGEVVTTTTSPLDWDDTVWNIFTPDASFNNIELVNPSTNSKGLIDLWTSATDDTLEFFSTQKMRFQAGGLKLSNYEIDSTNETWLSLKDTELKVELLNDTGSIDGVSTFQQDLKAKDNFKYVKNPQANYILAADDNTGQVSWRNKLDVFRGMPVGSIVSIPVEYFNDDNFYLDEDVSNTESNQPTLFLRWGAGKDNGSFIGWYVCGGMTWESECGAFNTPNLNAFTYQIDANGQGQITTNGGSNEIILLAGAKHSVDADYTGSNEYEISSTLTDTDETVSLLHQSTSANYYRSRNVHIVYLGVSGMKWRDDGTLVQEDFENCLPDLMPLPSPPTNPVPVPPVDTTAPVITLNGNATYNLTVGDSFTDLGATALDDVDGDISANIQVGGDTVDTNTIGTYQITYNVSDSAGNAATEVIRTIEVAAAPDTSAPVIVLNGDNPYNMWLGETYVEPGGTVTDDVDGIIPWSNVQIGGNLNESVTGSWIVTYNVTDAAGNAAAQVVRDVIITNNNAPNITLNGSNNITLTVGDNYVEPGYSASDFEDGDVTSDVVVGGDVVDTNTVGTYVITYDVTDSLGKSAPQETRTVNVQAPVAPNSIDIIHDFSGIVGASAIEYILPGGTLAPISGNTLTVSKSEATWSPTARNTISYVTIAVQPGSGFLFDPTQSEYGFLTNNQDIEMIVNAHGPTVPNDVQWVTFTFRSKQNVQFPTSDITLNITGEVF